MPRVKQASKHAHATKAAAVTALVRPDWVFRWGERIRIHDTHC